MLQLQLGNQAKVFSKNVSLSFNINKIGVHDIFFWEPV